MTDQLTARFNAREFSITESDFERWQKLYTWDAIKGIGYGDSFCQHFEIFDVLLKNYNLHTDDFERYIREAYVA